VASIRLIHIAPELPPTVGGLADYTAILSQRVVEVSDGAVETVLVHSGHKPTEAVEVDFPSVDLSGTCSATALAETIERLAGEAEGPAVVLLEYSGYGYAKRGAPLWLVRGVRQVCGGNALPLMTMFHELYATGPPWTSAFWMSPVQVHVLERLVRLSCAVLTNRVASAQRLRQYVRKGVPVRARPVFSNVGEPDYLPEFGEREPYSVVFGGSKMKQRLYSDLNLSHVREMQCAGIERIVDVGAPVDSPGEVHGLPIEQQGLQPAQAVQDVLLSARAGLLHHPISHLTKSGIWSSYAAHGVPSLIVSEPQTTTEISEGEHYVRLTVDGELPSTGHLRSVGAKAWEWYQKEAESRTTAKHVMDLLRHVNDWQTD
jgi:hypothetical protein